MYIATALRYHEDIIVSHSRQITITKLCYSKLMIKSHPSRIFRITKTSNFLEENLFSQSELSPSYLRRF